MIVKNITKMFTLDCKSVEEYNRTGILTDNIVAAYRNTKSYLESNHHSISHLDFVPQRKLAYIRCNNTLNTLDYVLGRHPNLFENDNLIQTEYEFSVKGSIAYIRSKFNNFCWTIQKVDGNIYHRSTNGSQNQCLDALDSILGEDRYATDSEDSENHLEDEFIIKKIE